MSRWISRYCLRQIVFCCLLCSVSMFLLFLNRPNINDFMLVLTKPAPESELAHEILQLERKNLIQEKCRDAIAARANEFKPKMANPVRFKIEDRHRVMYCDVPKVASTNLKRLMLILSGAIETGNLSSIARSTVHEKNPMRVLYANSLNDVTAKNGVENFTKFIFVRHPFERLVSAYKDKFAGDDDFYQKAVGRGIIRKFRKNPSPLSLQKGHDVTFPEFVDFVVNEWKDGRRPLDVHWRPVVDLCLPCAMQFDFIGKFETLNQDVEFLLRKLNESELIRLFADQPKAKTTSSLSRQSMKMLSSQQLNDLHRTFGEDLLLFGYPKYTGDEEKIELLSLQTNS